MALKDKVGTGLGSKLKTNKTVKKVAKNVKEAFTKPSKEKVANASKAIDNYKKREKSFDDYHTQRTGREKRAYKTGKGIGDSSGITEKRITKNRKKDIIW